MTSKLEGDSAVHISNDKKDTSFNYAILSKKGIVFETIQQIGSFTVIKLWKYPNSSQKNSKQISEHARFSYIYDKNVKKMNNFKQIDGIELLTDLNTSQKDALKLNYIFAENTLDSIYVDPSRDYYLVSTEDVNGKSQEFQYKKGAWNVGAMYLPLKLRPFSTSSGFFDFVSDFSVGTSLSFTLKQNLITGLTTNLIFYAGVSSIKVDSAIAADPSNSTFKQSQNITAFSPAIGMYWEKNNIQIGFVVGMDLPSRNLQKTWVYRNMPWIGLSAGITLFKLTNNSGNSENATQSK